jgi:CRISPR system Cascade subunit CasC
MSLTIDFHVLQTVPPANVNRDEDGSPKTATYGGTRRARVSSQAWKRAIRNDCKGFLDDSDLGVRSLRLVDDIKRRIQLLDSSLADQAEDYAVKVLTQAGLKITPSKPRKEDPNPSYQKTGALLFLSNVQMDELAQLAIGSKGIPDKKAVKAVLAKGNSIDLALFGRMVADSPDLNVDAASQVAHALGVHTVVSEFDYFTAVDDHAPDDNAGAGMIGTVEFNSSTLYRYATINVDALAATLGSGEATARAAEAFARAFVSSMPTGKQNTFANRTLPDFVLVTVRDDQPVNLAGAFEEAVDVAGNRVREAAARLVAHAKGIEDAYGTKPLASYAIVVGSDDSGVTQIAEKTTLPQLVEQVGEQVRTRLGVSA